jgi:hypothetical protein
MPPLDCGCPDPWLCRCSGAQLTENMIAAAVAAAELLDGLGTPGLFDADTCRAMHRRGYERLALEAARQGGGGVNAQYGDR